MSKLTVTQAIEAIKETVDIVAIVSKYIKVNKTGSSYKAICPFHADTKPSMSISSEKGIFKCFSCGASGDGLEFVKRYRNLSFIEAIKELGEFCGFELADQDPKAREEEDTLAIFYEINQEASLHFQKNLHNPSAGQEALDYLKEKRLLSEETIADFGLGYSSSSRNDLFRQIKEKFAEKLTPDLIVSCGLFFQDDRSGEISDRFRARLMIPILDQRSRVVGFGSRTLKAGEEPKYINSPETPVYRKGEHLFGLVLAAKIARERGSVLLLEGYFDVISAHQSGLKQAVASLGTALSETQARLLLKSNTKRQVVLGYDNDLAGLKAMEAALLVFEKICGNVIPDLRALSLPEGCKDIDDFLLARREELEAAENLLKALPKAASTLISKLSSVLGLDREGALRRLAETFRHIQDPIQRELLAEETARVLDFSKATVMLAFSPEKSRLPERKNNSIAKTTHGKAQPINNSQKTILALLLKDLGPDQLAQISELVLPDSELETLKQELLLLAFAERTDLVSTDKRLSDLSLLPMSDKPEDWQATLADCLEKLGSSGAYLSTKKAYRFKGLIALPLLPENRE